MSITASEMTPADIAAVTNNNCGNGNGMGWGGNWAEWIILFLIFGMFGWGGFGFGGGFGGGYGGGAGLQGMATRADINEGFALNNLQSGINAIQQGICDSTYALNNAITSGFNGTNTALMQGQNAMQSQLASCCCGLERAIDGVNYNMATNTCTLQNTMNNNTRDIIDNQNAGTRAILDYLCQDKISTLQNENQALRLAASQSNQNAVLMAAMDANTAQIIRRTGNDCPIPAYVVPNPNCCYGNPVGVNYGGGNCNNNNGCCGCGY